MAPTPAADEPQTDREWLMRVDGKVDKIIESQAELKKVVMGDDGQHGLCGRVNKLEGQQMKWLGRDGAIVAGISACVSVAGLAIALWRS